MHPLVVTLVELLPSPVIEAIETVRKMNKRQLILQVLGFCTVIMSAYMPYKFVSVLTNNPSPATVVLSYKINLKVIFFIYHL